MLHRDIKPSNLILDALGNIWITDFGLAKFDDGDDLSHSQDLVGTLRFMAPERFRGVSEVRCDVYALGATLYEMVTLRPCFSGQSHAELIRLIEHEPPVLPRQIKRGIPADLETIVLKALAKIPGDRFSSAEEMAAELRLARRSRSSPDRPSISTRWGSPSSAPVYIRRRSTLWTRVSRPARASRTPSTYSSWRWPGASSAILRQRVATSIAHFAGGVTIRARTGRSGPRSLDAFQDEAEADLACAGAEWPEEIFAPQ